MNERALCKKLVIRLIPLCMICSINVDSELIHRGAECVTGIIKLNYSVAVLFIPHKIPVAGISLVNDICVIDNTDNAVGIRNGIFVIGIIIEALEVFVDILVVRNIIKIQRLEQLFVCHSRYHVIRGDNNVVADCTARYFVIHILV